MRVKKIKPGVWTIRGDGRKEREVLDDSFPAMAVDFATISSEIP